jgi:hypothetical protein
MRIIKYLLIAMAVFMTLVLVSTIAYYEYYGHMYEKDPLFFYKGRGTMK